MQVELVSSLRYNNILLIDASFVCGASFDLSWVLQMGLLRGKPITCFVKNKHSEPVPPNFFPAELGAVGVCCRLAACSSGVPANYHTVPLLLMETQSFRAAAPTSIAALVAAKLAGGDLHGFHIEACLQPKEWWESQEQLRNTALNAYQQSDGEQNLPERFSDAALWQHNAAKEHPVYTTSSREIGSKGTGAA